MSRENAPVVGRSDEFEWEQVAACPMCSAAGLVPWRANRADSRGSVTRLTYRRCSACDCRVLTPRIAEASIGKLYGHSYAPYLDASTEGDLATVGRDGSSSPVQTHLRQLYSGQGKRVLDFGCGTATFVNAAREIGWETCAVDFTEAGVAGARGAGHEVRLVDDSFSEWLGSQRFDVIRLNHVIEHLYDPSDQLAAMFASLREGGTIHVVTPDPGGPAASIVRRRCVFFEAIHVTLIPPRSLELTARRIGADKVVVIAERTIKDLWRSFQLAAGRADSYEVAAAEPSSRWVRRALRMLIDAAAGIGRVDRYHAFISK